jgi:hypothetical protein
MSVESLQESAQLLSRTSLGAAPIEFRREK